MVNTTQIMVHAFNTASEEIPLYLSTLDSKCHGLKTESPHRHTFYEILFITDGEGTHIVDFETYALRPPMVFFVSPGQVHFWRLSKFLEGHALLFSEDFLVFPGAALNQADEIGFFHTVGKAPELVLKNDQRIKINLLLEYIQQERITAALNQASVLRAWLHVLIVELQRLFAATPLRRAFRPAR